MKSSNVDKLWRHLVVYLCVLLPDLNCSKKTYFVQKFDKTLDDGFSF